MFTQFLAKNLAKYSVFAQSQGLAPLTDIQPNTIYFSSVRESPCSRAALKVCWHSVCLSLHQCPSNLHCVNEDGPFDRQNGYRVHSAHQTVRLYWYNDKTLTETVTGEIGSCLFTYLSHLLWPIFNQTPIIFYFLCLFITTCTRKKDAAS